MECFSEQTYAIYCDDELAPAEAESVVRHLEECAPCHARVASLREERDALRVALRAPAEAPSPSPFMAPRRLILLWKLLAFAVVAALPYWLLNGLEQQLPLQVRWLNPFSLSGLFDLFSNAVFYLAKNGAVMISLFDQFSNLPALALLVILGVLMLTRFRYRLVRPGLGLLMLLVLVVPGYSLETRSSKSFLTVPATETINDTLIALGDTVQINGTVNGDLIAVGRSVEVRGAVKGNLIAFAKTVEVYGTVNGSIFSFSQILDARGHADTNLYACGRSVFLPKDSQVGGNVIAAASDLTLEGTVERGVLAATGTTDLRGTVNGDFKFYGGQLNVSDPAHIGGNFLARLSSLKHLNIAPSVFIGGKKTVSVRHIRNPYAQPKFYFWKAVMILGALLVGLILWLLTPGFYASTTQAMSSWLRSLGLGFAILFGLPIAVVILLITLVGLPLGLIALVAYLVSLYLAQLAAAFFLGRLLFRPSTGSGKFAVGVVGWTPPSNAAGFLLMLAVGWILLTIVFQIPYGVGAIIHFLVFCFGLGAVTWAFYRFVRPQSNA